MKEQKLQIDTKCLNAASLIDFIFLKGPVQTFIFVHLFSLMSQTSLLVFCFQLLGLVAFSASLEGYHLHHIGCCHVSFSAGFSEIHTEENRFPVFTGNVLSFTTRARGSAVRTKAKTQSVLFLPHRRLFTLTSY